MSGDGGFTMLMGDILTLTQQKLPAKIVIFNNGTLGFVEMEMKAAGYLETGVSLKNPRLRRDGGGDRHQRASASKTRATCPKAPSSEMLSPQPGTGPARRCHQPRKELSMPPKLQAEQVKGFSLYVMRAVMSGRGDSVLDLAKTNLIR